MKKFQQFLDDKTSARFCESLDVLAGEVAARNLSAEEFWDKVALPTLLETTAGEPEALLNEFMGRLGEAVGETPYYERLPQQRAAAQGRREAVLADRVKAITLPIKQSFFKMMGNFLKDVQTKAYNSNAADRHHMWKAAEMFYNKMLTTAAQWNLKGQTAPASYKGDYEQAQKGYWGDLASQNRSRYADQLKNRRLSLAGGDEEKAAGLRQQAVDPQGMAKARQDLGMEAVPTPAETPAQRMRRRGIPG